MKQRLLLTGASSFLGKRLSEALEQEYIVIRTSRSVNNEKSVLIMDLTEISQIEKIFSRYKPDILVHTGALVNLSRDVEVGTNCLFNNALGTYYLLDIASKYKLKKYVYISTEEVYGNGPIPFVEDQAIYPSSPYAISKAAGEYYSINYSQEYSVPTDILRLGSFYGPGQPPSKYFFQVVKQALQDSDILTNTAKKKRDYLYIDDAIAAIQAAIRNQHHRWEVFNITGGVSYSLDTVLSFIVKYTNSDSIIRYEVIPERITERDEWLANISKSKSVLNWSPTVSLELGLKRMIEYVTSI